MSQAHRGLAVEHATGRFEWERTLRELDIKPMTMLVALVLASYADADGFNAHPGEDRLASNVGLTPRAVRTHLGALRDLGLVRRTFAGSTAGRRKLADEYALTMPPDILARVRDHRHPGSGDAGEHRHPGSGATPGITGTSTSEHRNPGADHRNLDVAITGTPVPPTTTCTTDADQPSSRHASGDLSSRRTRASSVEPHEYPIGADECDRCPLPAANPRAHTNHRAAS